MKQDSREHVVLKKEIILNLLYSEIFQHPLSKKEVVDFLQLKIEANSGSFNQLLDELTQCGLIGCKEGYYYLFEENNKIHRRIAGNDKAHKLMPKAYKVARFIHGFPFVQGVGISGSLSKGVMNDDGDFDFFIITQPNRLWIARTLLIVYKKLFLFNSKKYFCVNYFIDTNNLEIEEKNKFTATEIATLIPASGSVLFQFYQTNSWIQTFYPNKAVLEPYSDVSKKPIFSRMIAFCLKGKLGEWFDEWFMKLTLRRWKKKFNEFDNQKFGLTMKSRKYVSKHHPNDFQNKVLNKYSELIEQYKLHYADQLNKQQIEL